MRLALREVRLLKQAKHRNIIKLLEAFRSKSGRVYLVRASSSMEGSDRSDSREPCRGGKGPR